MNTHKLWRITLDTNPEHCNLACIMCEEHSPFSTYIQDKLGGKRRRMPQAWLAEIFQQAKALGVQEIIPSTMGEPLMYKHFDEIVHFCSLHHIKMNLTTNATFPKISGKSVEDWAALLVPVTSDVKFSWNGASAKTAEKIMEGLQFEKVLENVQRFVKVRDMHAKKGGNYCQLTFQLTFMQNNMHELADIIKLAASLGIDRVKGHQLWAHFEEIKNLSFRQNKESIEQWNAYVEEAHRAAEEYRKPDGQKVKLENIIPLAAQETREVPAHYECPFLKQELWISATGVYSPCCAPDEQRKSLGDFGNFQEKSIQEVLESKAYQHLVKNYKEHALCKTCTMRKPTT